MINVTYRVLLFTIAFLLLVLWLRPVALLAQEQNSNLIYQEIRYHMPEADELFLVWGINNWQLVPEEIRPRNTTIVNSVLHTSMKRVRDDFVVRIQVPAGVEVNFGFLIVEEWKVYPIYIWDGQDDRQKPYQIQAQDQVVRFQASKQAIKELDTKPRDIEIQRFFIVSLMSLGVIPLILLFRSKINSLTVNG